jgi:hypothetical protein
MNNLAAKPGIAVARFFTGIPTVTRTSRKRTTRFITVAHHKFDVTVRNKTDLHRFLTKGTAVFDWET